MSRIINITSNRNPVSQEIKNSLVEKLTDAGFTVRNVTSKNDFDREAELIVCIGGDGAMLRTLRYLDFPQMPIIGVNTGHLGFFQEIAPEQLDSFVEAYEKGSFIIQELKVAQAEVDTVKGKAILSGLNEIVIKSDMSRSVHLNLFFGDNFVERFSGDGLLISTPAGSTAYNYALGGCIVDPRIDLLQVTPMAPMNTKAFRSFTSSVIVPPEICINIEPEFTFENSLLLVADGYEYTFSDINHITISFSKEKVQLLRLEGYEFWNKVKTKFLE